MTDLYAYNHNVTARRQTTAFQVVHGIPDAQRAAATLARAGHDGHLLRLGVLFGAVAAAVAGRGDVHRALLELSTAAHGWIDDLQQEVAA